MTKYTGARGKSGSNDASAETMAKVIQIMDEAGVYWQIGELGAVDVGGGGTVALFVAGMDGRCGYGGSDFIHACPI